MDQTEQLPEKLDEATIMAVIQLLRKYNLKSTEETLKHETNIDVTILGVQESSRKESQVSSILSACKSEGDFKVQVKDTKDPLFLKLEEKVEELSKELQIKEEELKNAQRHNKFLSKELQTKEEELKTAQCRNEFLKGEKQELLNDLKKTWEEVGSLNEELKCKNYYRYLNVVRNEISKFDKRAWETNFTLTPYQEDLQSIKSYEDLQEEKRRIRLTHVFKYSAHEDVDKLLTKIHEREILLETFASELAKAYRIISNEIHNLSYTIYFKGKKCIAVTSNNTTNECINVLLEDVAFNVGEMVDVRLPSRKRKSEQEVKSGPSKSLEKLFRRSRYEW